MSPHDATRRPALHPAVCVLSIAAKPSRKLHVVGPGARVRIGVRAQPLPAAGAVPRVYSHPHRRDTTAAQAPEGAHRMTGEIIDARHLGAALRALALQEVQALLEALANKRARHRGVHEARKAIRRLRSLLLLGRSGFGTVGERLDADLKHLATSLSALRDAHVVVDTAGGMLRGAHGEKVRKRWTALRRQLSMRRKQVLDAALSADPGFEQRRGDVVRHADTIDRLPWQALEHDTLRRELTRSLRRMRKAERRATRPDADIEQRHRWRRRLRRLRMQWNALKMLHKRASDTGVRADSQALLVWLRTQAPRFAHVAASADALGADQDLILLHAAIEHLPASHARDLALQDIEAKRAAMRA